MKKLVPDPPYAYITPGVSHEEAILKAEEFVMKAIAAASGLPEPAKKRHQEMLGESLLYMRIAKAFLVVASAKSTQSVLI
ncbi:MAG: hypothetical protein LBJ37_13740 [Paucimonas sp.]|jgi:hypothetical protein|nr:hypothetical protein [Paucimonas sp.]